MTHCQAQFTPGDKSPQSWLKNGQNIETLCNKLSVVDLLE